MTLVIIPTLLNNNTNNVVSHLFHIKTNSKKYTLSYNIDKKNMLK